MSSKTTWRLFFAAAAMFAFIMIVERHANEKLEATGPQKIFPALVSANVVAVEITSSNLLVRAEKTNDGWRLTRPFYPAQATPITDFVDKFTALPKAGVISATEVFAQPGKLRDFGLDPPAATLAVTQGSNRFVLNVGSLTAMRDQLYAQMPGSAEVLVTDPSILKVVPQNANLWRSQMLLNMGARTFDRIQIRAQGRLLEFGFDTTNEAWRISKPTPARANNVRVTELLQQVATTRVKEFVTDSPTVDLERFGLQTPTVELAFALDTNRVTALEFGASPTNDPGSVYVRRLSTTNVVLVSREVLDSLNLPAKAFHDPRLVSMEPAQLAAIQVRTTNSSFTITRGTNGWVITEPALAGADAGLVRAFLTNLFDMTIENFAKDVPTDADLKQFGLTPSLLSYSLFTAPTNAAGAITNKLAMQLDFGLPAPEGTIYARRSDETPVYLSPDVSFLLPHAAWQLRSRQIYDFAPKDVLTISMAASGKTNQLTRQGPRWAADDVLNAATEETVFRLGKLNARNWVFKGTRRNAQYGFSTNSIILDVALMPGVVDSSPPIVFGKPAMRNNVYAATVLPGDVEPTVFEFPGDLYQSLLSAFGLQAPR